MPVKDFMTKKLVYVSPDTTVAEAADLLREHHLRRLPVSAIGVSDRRDNGRSTTF